STPRAHAAEKRTHCPKISHCTSERRFVRKLITSADSFTIQGYDRSPNAGGGRLLVHEHDRGVSRSCHAVQELLQLYILRGRDRLGGNFQLALEDDGPVLGRPCGVVLAEGRIEVERVRQLVDLELGRKLDAHCLAEDVRIDYYGILTRLFGEGPIA